MRVAVVGSRDFADLNLVRGFVRRLAEKYPDAILVSGGARGVDRTAEIAAHMSGLETVCFLPDWELHGKRAGFVRNTRIVENCDRLVAFWDGKSRGTKDSIVKAQDRGVPVHIIRAE